MSSPLNGSQCLTILFVPNDGLENITSLRVLADELQERGHRIVFSIDKASNGLIAFNGFKNDLNGLSKLSPQMNNNFKFDVDFDVFQMSEIKIFENFCLKKLWKKFLETKDREIYYKKLIQYIKPDLIIVESIICSPALTTSAIPWVWLNFGAPNLCLDDERLPPAWSGLSKDSDNENWLNFREEKNNLLANLRHEVNDWCISKGVESLPKHSLHPHSPYLNVYIYPRELDYDLGKTFPPEKWFRFSSLMKTSEDVFHIPQELAAKSGKLVYLSLGAYGSADINLMKRLTTILSYSSNKFFLSKDLNFELPDNFWVFNDLPQTEAIKAADLVITNGDNNSITEALFWAKPMIVMPLFGDQLDNAQRVKDNGLGIILEPYKCRLSTTIGSINALLEDYLVYRRLNNISYKMQNSDENKKLYVLIEDICKQ